MHRKDLQANYLGPTLTRNDGSEKVKTWVILITCLSTRAVYLEAIRSLSASAFLNVLRRFMARRGCPRRIISDNAPHFLLASRTLRTLTTELDADLASDLAARGIAWSFIPQYSPWAGGFYERLNGIAKRCLQKTLGQSTLDYDSFCSFLAEAEASVNLRPITYVSTDPDSPLPLRPIDFLQENQHLVLPPLARPTPAVFKDLTQQQLIAIWKNSRERCEHFWHRWQKEYLQILR